MPKQGVEISVAARLRLHARGARALQPRAAHPRQRRLRDLPRRHRRADGRRADRRSQHGILRELPQAEEASNDCLTCHLLSVMDRRDFIKLTAITGTSATLASCGNPEHQLIRFVPDDDIVPGVAEWKPSVCPLCAAGCGVIVRVMEADVEIVRNGQAGVDRDGGGEEARRATPTHPISQGGLCARGQASIQLTYHPDRLTHPMKRTGARGSGPVPGDHAGTKRSRELVAQLDALAAAGDQKALAFLTRPRRRPARLSSSRSSSNGSARRRRSPTSCSATMCCGARTRSASAASSCRRSISRATRFAIVVRRRLPRHLEFAGRAERGVRADAAGAAGVRGTFVQVESRMSLTGASADEWVPVQAGHRRRAGARPRARASWRRNCGRPTRGTRRRG